MSNKDEIEELRREIEKLKEELRSLRKLQEERRTPIGVSIAGFVGDLVESIVEGIRSEVERSVFVGPRGVYIVKGRRETSVKDFDVREAARILEALANENRLKILKALSKGGKYLKELQEELPEVSAGTLSSHLNVLQEAGLVVQEAVRGRYLITIPGRLALKMISNLASYLGGSRVET